MILGLRPILSESQYKLLSLEDGTYELVRSKTSWSVMIGGKIDVKLSHSLRSLIKRKIVRVLGKKITITDHVGWNKIPEHHHTELDDIIKYNGELFRVWKVTDYSTYCFSNYSGKELILGRWILKSKNSGNDITVYSKHIPTTEKYTKLDTRRRNKRYQESPNKMHV